MQEATLSEAALPTVLQEVVAAGGHVDAALGFGLARAISAMAKGDRDGEPRTLLWVRQDAAVAEAGRVYGPGVAAFGLDPAGLLMVEARTFVDALRAGLEGVRCQALGAVLIETVTPLDLTASRRLKLAAEKSGVATVLVRHADQSAANAAPVRWQVGRWPDGTAARDAAARDGLRFAVELTKHPAGRTGRRWLAEWDHERRLFKTIARPDVSRTAATRCGATLLGSTLSSPLAAVPERGSLAA